MISCNGAIINCTLWDGYATKYREAMKDTKNEGNFVIILTQTKIKAASGSKYIFLYIVFVSFEMVEKPRRRG